MTQQEVFKLLEKENKWMNAKEIAKKLKVGYGSIKKNLHVLSYGNWVKIKAVPNPNKKGTYVFYYMKRFPGEDKFGWDEEK